MSERKKIKLYGRVIDTLHNYKTKLQMPLLPQEQALLCRAIKNLSTCPSLMAQHYVHQAEQLLN